jgi:hypothetical protein
MESKNPTLEEQHKMQLLFSKLRSPIHYSYIAQYILRENKENTLSLLSRMEEMGLVQESPHAKGYFVNATGPSGPSSLSNFSLKI